MTLIYDNDKLKLKVSYVTSLINVIQNFSNSLDLPNFKTVIGEKSALPQQNHWQNSIKKFLQHVLECVYDILGTLYNYSQSVKSEESKSNLTI